MAGESFALIDEYEVHNFHGRSTDKDPGAFQEVPIKESPSKRGIASERGSIMFKEWGGKHRGGVCELMEHGEGTFSHRIYPCLMSSGAENDILNVLVFGVTVE